MMSPRLNWHFPYILMACLLLSLAACQSGPFEAGFPRPEASHQGLIGKVQAAQEWHYARARSGDSTGEWHLTDSRDWHYDSSGALQETHQWKHSRAHEHTIYHYDKAGALRQEDQRVVQGRPGGKRNLYREANTAYSQTFNASGQLIEQVERGCDDEGRLIRRSQRFYHRDAQGDRVHTHWEWRTEYLPGDSSIETTHKDEVLQQKEIQYRHEAVRIEFYDEQGRIQQIAVRYPASKRFPQNWLYIDAQGREIRKSTHFVSADGSGYERNVYLDTLSPGRTATVHEWDGRGRLRDTRTSSIDPQGRFIQGPRQHFAYQDDLQGNWTLKLEWADSILAHVWARRITYFPENNP